MHAGSSVSCSSGSGGNNDNHDDDSALFISHAWNEPYREFTRNVLAAWPKHMEDAGAYICFLYATYLCAYVYVVPLSMKD